jgi:hypothetical protein
MAAKRRNCALGQRSKQREARLTDVQNSPKLVEEADQVVAVAIADGRRSHKNFLLKTSLEPQPSCEIRQLQ